MTLLLEILSLLAFRSRSLRAVAAKKSLFSGLLWLSAGFLSFVLIRNSVYAGLQEPIPGIVNPGLFDSLFQLNLLQAVAFFAGIYVPVIIALSNAFAADGRGFTVSGGEYRAHGAVLLPLWGLLFLVAAPIQWVAPQFLVLGVFFGISIGLLVLILLLATYSIWAIKELNFLPLSAAAGVFLLSSLTLPLFYVMTAVLYALPLFLMIPLLYLLFQRVRSLSTGRVQEREFQRQLVTLTANPQDADAHHQLGLLHMKRGNLESARRYFEQAGRIDPSQPEYHYQLGRVMEAQGEWAGALEQYEETYRLDPNFALGDILREVGKGYLHTGRVEKAIEFLRYFLGMRSSDPEARYWLAVALKESDAPEEMRVQLNTLLEQARSNPAFFRRENREWIYRARRLLRE
jgi:tetratricopeptide (TPR) repeat protein